VDRKIKPVNFRAVDRKSKGRRFESCARSIFRNAYFSLNVEIRNFIVKIAKKFSKHNAKNYAWKFLIITVKSEKNEIISFSYESMTMFTLTQNLFNFKAGQNS